MSRHHRYPGSLFGSREEELKRWLGYIETHIDYLVELLMEAYPRTSPEYHYAKWTRLRLQFFLNMVRVKLGLRPH